MRVKPGLLDGQEPSLFFLFERDAQPTFSFLATRAAMHLTPLDSALMACVWAGDAAGVERRIALGALDVADPHARTLSLDSALETACQVGRADIARLLLGAGASPLFREGVSLAWAIERADAELCGFLLESIFDGGKTSSRMWLATIGWNPLEKAAEAGARGVLDIWAERKLLPFFRESDIQAALCAACLRGADRRCVEILLGLGVDLRLSSAESSQPFGLNLIALASRNRHAGPLEALCQSPHKEALGPLALPLALSNVVRQPEPPAASVKAIAQAIDWTAASSVSDLNNSLFHCARSPRLAPALNILFSCGAPPHGINTVLLNANGSVNWGQSPRALAFAALDGDSAGAIRAMFDFGVDFGSGSDPASPLSKARAGRNAETRAASAALIACVEQRDLLAVASQAQSSATQGDPAPVRKPLSL